VSLPPPGSEDVNHDQDKQSGDQFSELMQRWNNGNLITQQDDGSDSNIEELSRPSRLLLPAISYQTQPQTISLPAPTQPVHAQSISISGGYSQSSPTFHGVPECVALHAPASNWPMTRMPPSAQVSHMQSDQVIYQQSMLGPWHTHLPAGEALEPSPTPYGDLVQLRSHGMPARSQTVHMMPQSVSRSGHGLYKDQNLDELQHALQYTSAPTLPPVISALLLRAEWSPV